MHLIKLAEDINYHGNSKYHTELLVCFDKIVTRNGNAVSIVAENMLHAQNIKYIYTTQNKKVAGSPCTQAFSNVYI